MRLERWIDLFIGDLSRRSRVPGGSADTRRTYRRILDKFADQHRDVDPATITTNDCRAFLDRWIDASPATVALHITILFRFFEFLRSDGAIVVNPMETIKRPRLLPAEERDVVTVSDEDVERLFLACEDWQEFVTLSVLAYLGPRRSAAANLRQSDVDLAAGTARFVEKGGKVIWKPIPDELAKILRAAWTSGDLALGPDEYVIPNRRPGGVKGRERSDKIVWETVRRLAKRAGVKAHAHAIRAAFAVRFDEQHPDQNFTLRDLMGHARIETTLVYLRRRKRALAMERVRDLSWGAAAGFVLPPRALEAHTGFEPVLPENPLGKPGRTQEEPEGSGNDLVDNLLGRLKQERTKERS